MNKEIQKEIVYVGAFELPDKNAAAHRVLNNAKCFRELNMRTTFIDMQKKDYKKSHEIICDGIEVYHRKYPRSLIEYLKYGYSIKEIKYILKRQSNIEYLIVYNIFSLVFFRLLLYCKINNIKIISDCTEWYSTSKYNFVKKLDIFIRMRILNKLCDGIIVISSFLEEYYRKYKTVKVPPLIDENELKWTINRNNKTDKIVFSYCGFPEKKEKLDLFINILSSDKFNKYNFIFYIAGISRIDFCLRYPNVNTTYFDNKIIFLDMISHQESLNIIKNSDYGIIIREQNRTNNAGFPTKFVEYATLGTPVIASKISDISFYKSNNDIFIDEVSTASIENALTIAFERGKYVNKLDHSHTFSYKNYITKYKDFISSLS